MNDSKSKVGLVPAKCYRWRMCHLTSNDKMFGHLKVDEQKFLQYVYQACPEAILYLSSRTGWQEKSDPNASGMLFASSVYRIKADYFDSKENSMDWVTREEVKEAAKTQIGALQCSIKHWEQVRRANAETINKGLMEYKLHLDGRHCAL